MLFVLIWDKLHKPEFSRRDIFLLVLHEQFGHNCGFLLDGEFIFRFFILVVKFLFVIVLVLHVFVDLFDGGNLIGEEWLGLHVFIGFEEVFDGYLAVCYF